MKGTRVRAAMELEMSMASLGRRLNLSSTAVVRISRQSFLFRSVPCKIQEIDSSIMTAS